MSYFVESLCNTKKESRAQAFVFKSFFIDVSDTMRLVYCTLIFFSNQIDALALYVSLQ
jgi:hypothetical protein